MPAVVKGKTVLTRWDTCDTETHWYCCDCDLSIEREDYSEERKNCPKCGESMFLDPDADDTWDMVLEDLDAWIKEHNPDGLWEAKVTGFGWQNLSGDKEFKAEDGKTLLHELLPNADCTFNIYDEGDHLSMENAHHDSPTGSEWYRIYPVLGEEEG